MANYLQLHVVALHISHQSNFEQTTVHHAQTI